MRWIIVEPSVDSPVGPLDEMYLQGCRGSTTGADTPVKINLADPEFTCLVEEAARFSTVEDAVAMVLQLDGPEYIGLEIRELP